MFVRVVYELLRLLLRYDVVLLASLLVFVPLLKFRKNGGYLFAVLVAVYIAVPTAYHYCNNGEELWMYAGFQVANWYSICYIVYWLFAMLILFACFRVSVTDVLFYGTAAYTLQNFSHNIRAIVRAVAFGGAWSLLSCSVMFCIEAAILAIFYFAVVRRLHAMDETRLKNVYLIAFLVIVLLVVNVLSEYWQDQTQMGDYNNVDVSGSIYAVLSALLLIILQFGLFEQTKLKQDNAVMEGVLANAEKQQKFSQENIDIINRKSHDLRFQVEALRTSVSEEERAKYFGEIENAVAFYDNTAKTVNRAIDVILTEKSLFCEAHKIRFTYMLDGADFSFMETPDIHCLFGNLLENAVESVCRVSEEKRIISMRSVKKGNLLQLEIENYCDATIRFEDGLPVTTKGDKNYHGFGVKSIRYIAEKYGGTVEMAQKNNKFIARILFVH